MSIKLSALEENIVRLYLSGMKPREIAERLKCSIKTVYKAISKFRKLSSNMNNAVSNNQHVSYQQNTNNCITDSSGIGIEGKGRCENKSLIQTPLLNQGLIHDEHNLNSNELMNKLFLIVLGNLIQNLINDGEVRSGRAQRNLRGNDTSCIELEQMFLNLDLKVQEITKTLNHLLQRMDHLEGLVHKIYTVIEQTVTTTNSIAKNIGFKFDKEETKTNTITSIKIPSYIQENPWVDVLRTKK